MQHALRSAALVSLVKQWAAAAEGSSGRQRRNAIWPSSVCLGFGRACMMRARERWAARRSAGSGESLLGPVTNEPRPPRTVHIDSAISPRGDGAEDVQSHRPPRLSPLRPTENAGEQTASPGVVSGVLGRRVDDHSLRLANAEWGWRWRRLLEGGCSLPPARRNSRRNNCRRRPGRRDRPTAAKTSAWNKAAIVRARSPLASRLQRATVEQVLDPESTAFFRPTPVRRPPKFDIPDRRRRLCALDARWRRWPVNREISLREDPPLPSASSSKSSRLLMEPLST
uniref:Uncharacterized protein n=1 Tax=Plectus sambesii TaxID=2011161 RepID=A0A914WK18_9BILA